MKKHQVDLITMGCSKNLVDSEALARQFEAKGYRCVPDAQRPEGEIAVINTCGFIEAAKQESIDMILDFVRRKEEGQLQKLYVMGCLSQRYKAELEREIPEVDRYYGKFDYRKLLEELPAVNQGMDSVQGCASSQRHARLTPRHYAYLKIAEGCDRHCAYCAIPLMTGKHVSRPKAEILDEVHRQVASGVKEFQVIAQELTYYGLDLDGHQHIADLIEDIANVPGVKWIRLHYAYPNRFPMELLEVMARHDNVCKYLDIAFQHVSDNMLKRMLRSVSGQETRELISTIRAKVPGIHLRTTLMVGFPGETDEDFEELKQFVIDSRFERMGAFMYSEEEGTYSAAHYNDDVSQAVKQHRLDELMAIQQHISEEIEAAKVGQTLKVIIDRKEGDFYIGRTEYSSPEVDPEVIISSKRPLRAGTFYQARITGAEEFDLYGEVL